MEETALTFEPLHPMDEALTYRGHRELLARRRKEVFGAISELAADGTVAALAGFFAFTYAWGSIAAWDGAGFFGAWLCRLFFPIFSALFILVACRFGKHARDDWRTLTGETTAYLITPDTCEWARLEAELEFRLVAWNTRAESLNPTIALINDEDDESKLALEWRFAYAWMLAERRNIEHLASRIPQARVLPPLPDARLLPPPKTVP